MGAVGTVNLKDCTVKLDGILATGVNSFYKQTFTNTTVTVKGHAIRKEATYFSAEGTILGLTLDNSTITVDDGDADTVAEKVVFKTTTMKNNSSVTVESGTYVEVASGNTVTMDATSKLNVGTLTNKGKLSLVAGDASTASVNLTGYAGTGTITVDMKNATEAMYLLIDSTGASMTLADYGTLTFTNNTNGYHGLVINNDLYAANINPDMSVIAVNAAWTDKTVGEAIAIGDKTYYFGVNAFDQMAKFIPSLEGGTIIAYGNGKVAATETTAGEGIEINNSGTYSISGEEWSDLGYLQLNSEKAVLDERIVVNIDDSNLVANKVQARRDADYYITNSHLDFNNNTPSRGYTCIYANSTLNLTNSVYGYNAYVGNSADIVAGRAGIDATKIGPMDNKAKSAMQICGKLIADNSTLLTVTGDDTIGFGVLDKGYVELKDSVLYAGAIAVGLAQSDAKKKSQDTGVDVATMVLDNSVLIRQHADNFKLDIGYSSGVNGKLIVKNDSLVDRADAPMKIAAGSELEVSGSTVKVSALNNAGTITIDATSQIIATSFSGANGTITVDMTGASGDLVKLFDVTGTGDSTFGSYSLAAGKANGYALLAMDNDLYAIKADLSNLVVNAEWSGTVAGTTITVDTVDYIYGVNAFDNMAGAAKAALTAGESNIKVMGNAPIVAGSAFGDQDVTITGNATFKWNPWMYIGRDASQAFTTPDATVTFDGATIARDPANGDQSIHVSGAKKNSTSTGNGTLNIVNGSDITTEHIVDRNVINLTDSKLTVTNYINVHGRDASESVSGEDDTAYLNVENSTLKITGQPLEIGQEGKGIVNLTDSTLETNSIYAMAKGTLNVTDSTVSVSGAFTNKGNFTFNYGSTISVGSFNGADGTITVDMTGADPDNAFQIKLVDVTGTGASDFGNYSMASGKDNGYSLVVIDNDLCAMAADTSVLVVNAAYSDKTNGEPIILGNRVYYYGVNAFSNMADAAKAAKTGADTEIQIKGTDPIVSGSAFGDQNITIKGNGTFQWQGWMFIGRDASQAVSTKDATVTFDGATIARAASSGDQSIHVSGQEGDGSSKGNGTLNITNGSDIATDWIVNKNIINIDKGSKLTTNFFGIAGRPASETPTGEDATAILNVDAATVNVGNNAFGLKLGNEGNGIVNLTNGAVLNATSILNEAKGTINVDGSTLTATGTVTNAGTITIDATSVFSAAAFSGANGTITVDMTDATDSTIMLVNVTGTGNSNFGDYSFVTGKDNGYTLVVIDNDLYASTANISRLVVDAAWSTKNIGEKVYTDTTTGEEFFYGVNAFDKFFSAVQMAADRTEVKRITVLSNITETIANDYEIGQDLVIDTVADGNVVIDANSNDTWAMMSVKSASGSITIEKGVEIKNVRQWIVGYYEADNAAHTLNINGKLTMGQMALWSANSKAAGTVNINSDADVYMAMGDGVVDFRDNAAVNVTGTLADTKDETLASAKKQLHGGYIQIRPQAGVENSFNLKDTYVGDVAWMRENTNGATGKFTMNMDNSALSLGSINLSSVNATLNVENGSRLLTANEAALGSSASINLEDSEFKAGTLTNNGAVNVYGESKLNIAAATGNAIALQDGATLADSNMGGAVSAYGAATITASTITGAVNVGYNGYDTAADTLTFVGENKTGALYVGRDAESDLVDTLNFAADSETTTSGNLYIRHTGNVNVASGAKANVFGYLLNYGTVNVTDAELTVVPRTDGASELVVTGRPNKKANGGAKMTVDGSTVTAGILSVGQTTGGHIGTENDDSGSGEVTLKNGSVMNLTGNNGVALFIQERFDGMEAVKMDIDASTVNATGSAAIGANSELNVSNGAKMTVTGALTNAGTITIDTESDFKVTGLTTNSGTIVIDAANFAGGTKKVVDFNGFATGEGLTDYAVVDNLADGISVRWEDDGDVILSDAQRTVYKVNHEWATAGYSFGDAIEGEDGFVFGVNAFADVDDAFLDEMYYNYYYEDGLTKVIIDAADGYQYGNGTTSTWFWFYNDITIETVNGMADLTQIKGSVNYFQPCGETFVLEGDGIKTNSNQWTWPENITVNADVQTGYTVLCTDMTVKAGVTYVAASWIGAYETADVFGAMTVGATLSVGTADASIYGSSQTTAIYTLSGSSASLNANSVLVNTVNALDWTTDENEMRVVDGATATVTNTLTNKGIVKIDDATLAAKAITNAGTIQLDGAAVLTAANGIANNGKVTIGSADAAFSGALNATITGNGTVQVKNADMTIGSTNSIAAKNVAVGGMTETELGDNTPGAKVTVNADGSFIGSGELWVGSENDNRQTAETHDHSYILEVNGGRIHGGNQFTVRNDGYLYAYNGATVTGGAAPIRGDVLLSGEGTLMSFSNSANIYGEAMGAGENNGVSTVLVQNGASFVVNGPVSLGKAGVDTRQGNLVLDNGSATVGSLLLNTSGIVTLKNGGALTVSGALTNDGAINVGSDASITVGSMVSTGSVNLASGALLTFDGALNNTGAINVDMTGLTGFEYKVIDFVDDNADASTLGTLEATNDYKLEVRDGDLFAVKDINTDLVYVNTAWNGTAANTLVYTDEEPNGYFGQNAFAAIADATALTPEKMVVLGGSYSSKTQYMNGVDTTIENGIFANTHGGQLLKADKYKTQFVEADTNLTIENGTFTILSGADRFSGGLVGRVGDANLTIDGGKFNAVVCGGIYVTSSTTAVDHAVLEGDVNLTINGGIFTKDVYGGNVAANTSIANRANLAGNVNLTIDASQNAISFAGDVVVGSYGDGHIDGDVTVTVKGLGSNLSFTNKLIGANGSTTYKTDSSTKIRTFMTTISGSRNLAFNGFTGDFKADPGAFQNISFTGESDVNFTKSTLNMADATSWNFEFGSSASNIAINNFKGDTLSFDLADWEEDTDSWDVVSGKASSFTGWDDSSTKVYLDGTLASWNSDISGWATADFKLTLEDDNSNKKLTIAALNA
ncbi:MAG: hypothetical protein MJ202_00465 [Lentisphaeria bacterium]|nr:hypothetical protein [Lentisphaeria bacterium]